MAPRRGGPFAWCRLTRVQTAIDLLAAAENSEGVIYGRLRELLDDTAVGGITKATCYSEQELKLWAKVMKAEGIKVMASTNMVRGEAVGDRTLYVTWKTTGSAAS